MQKTTFDTSSLMEITARPATIFTEGKGSFLWDSTGKRYLDFVQGWAVNCLGHAPANIAGALARQAETLITPSPAFFNAPSIELATRLTEKSYFDEVFFTNSGGEAIEGAIKLARKFGAKYKSGAYEIITFDGAFHGRTLAAMSASGKKAFEPLFEPKVPGFPKATLNELASVKALINDSTVAIMLEPIQGEAGVWPASDKFMQELRALADENGLLLIADEIQTGIGRTGKLWGYEHSGITPDIMTLGKGIGGGVPLGAVLATKAASCFEHGDQGGTYNGNPLMCAVGNVVMEEVANKKFLANVEANGELLMHSLAELSAKYGLGKTRGRGLLVALDLGRECSGEIVADAMDAGLLINGPRPDSLRFMPALNVTSDEIDEAVKILDAVFPQL